MKSKTANDKLLESLAAAKQAVSDVEGAKVGALYERQAQLHTQNHAHTGRQLRILVVDDDPSFRDGIVKEAERLNQKGSASFEIKTLHPVTADDVVKVIEDGHKEKKYFDLLLLDYELREQELTAKHVLQALNEHKAPHIRYLPRLIITQKDTEQDFNLPDMLISMGADGIHFYKGGGVQAAQPGQSHYALILQSLQLSEYKEIRVRAWGRMWRDIRNRIEDAISHQRDTACTSHTAYCTLLSQIWKIVFDELKDSNYVKRASFRVFNDRLLDSIDPTDDVLKEADIEKITWDRLPYVKEWLSVASEESRSATEWLALHKQFIINKLERKDIGDPSLYKILEGRQTIGMPLFTHHGPIGLFKLVRSSTAPPFGTSDWEQMLTVGLRLALHAQDLRNRWRAYDRGQVLHRLHHDISHAKDEEEIWQLAVRTVHETVFQRIQGLHGTAQMPPPTGVDPDGRTSLRRMDPDRQLSGWGYGFGIIGQKVQTLKLLDAEQKCIIKEVFDTGAPRFYLDTKEVPEYIPPEEGANRSLIHIPVKADGVCFAVFSVGHRQVGFFGASKEQSCDWQFLADCADLLGQALAQRHSAKLQTAALGLLLNLSNEPKKEQSNENDWIDQVVGLLNSHAVGCAAVLWLTPPDQDNQADSIPWQLSRGWEFVRPNANDHSLYSMSGERHQQWQAHINGRWQVSYCARTVAAGDPLVNFTDKELLQDEGMVVHTASQLNLRIALTKDGETMALLVLLFSVPKPINTPQQRAFLERLAMLCAVYLQDRKRLLDLGNWQSLAQRNEAWSEAYQQMRHQLRDLKDDVEHRIDTCLNELKGREITVSQAVISISELQKGLQKTFSSVVEVLNTSTILTRELQIMSHRLVQLLAPVLESTRTRTDALGVTIHSEIDENLEINTDGDLLKLVISNLLSNALDEFRLQAAGSANRPLRNKGDPSPEIWVKFVAPGQNVGAREVRQPTLLVHDNGPGVLSAMQAELFSGKSNKGGTGFQLSFSRKALECQDWHLEHWAGVGQGACFAIELPPEAMISVHQATV